MITIARSIAMAFSMFSKIPMPMVEWKKENMKYMLCALPLVGIVIGLALMLWNYICGVLHIGQFFYAAGMTFIPLFITGGIHMDGFADTIDALSSHASPDRKREILKDSHAGAFAIIYTAAYMIIYFAVSSELVIGFKTALFVMLIHVFARCCGAFAGTAFKGSAGKGLLSSFRDGASSKASLILLILGIISCALLIIIFPIGGIICTAAGLVLLLYLRWMSEKEFGGMSGDLAGYLITICELICLIGFVITFKVVNL